MRAFRSTLLVALVSLVACDEGLDDADRSAEDLDLEADVEEDEDDELDLVGVAPPAPTRTDASGVDEDQPSLSLAAADIEPDAARRQWDCGGDPEGGTYNCCIPWGPYDVPYCCWWNGGGYDCG